MSRSNDYNGWDDQQDYRRIKKSENKKNKKRMNSKELMERWGKYDDDDDLYSDREKFGKGR